MTTQTDNSAQAPANAHEDLSPEARLARTRRALRRRVKGSADSVHPHAGDEGASSSSIASALQAWARPTVTALAKRHPYGLLTVAAATGALAVWWRPWRGVLGSLAIAALMRQARTWSFELASRHFTQSTLNHFSRRHGPSDNVFR